MDWKQHPQFGILLLHLQNHTLCGSMTIMGPFVPKTNGYFNQMCPDHFLYCNSLGVWYSCSKNLYKYPIPLKNPLHLVFMAIQLHSINFLLKFITFDPLLSPHAWLVKWHNCDLVNNSITDITEKFSLFCNCRASSSITAPAVFEWFKTVLTIFYCIALNCWILINCDYWLIGIVQQNKPFTWTLFRTVILSVNAVAACDHVRNVNAIIILKNQLTVLTLFWKKKTPIEYW